MIKCHISKIPKCIIYLASFCHLLNERNVQRDVTLALTGSQQSSKTQETRCSKICTAIFFITHHQSWNRHVVSASVWTCFCYLFRIISGIKTYLSRVSRSFGNQELVLIWWNTIFEFGVDKVWYGYGECGWIKNPYEWDLHKWAHCSTQKDTGLKPPHLSDEWHKVWNTQSFSWASQDP